VHASGYDWDTSNRDEPKLICLSNEPKWDRAEVNLVALAAIVGDLMADLND